jgi:hypothetical protein
VEGGGTRAEQIKEGGPAGTGTDDKVEAAGGGTKDGVADGGTRAEQKEEEPASTGTDDSEDAAGASTDGVADGGTCAGKI